MQFFPVTTLLISLITLPIFLGCSSEQQLPEDYLVRVNGYTISANEIDSQIKLETKLDSNFYLTDDTRTEFVQDLIQTQLLIQEAKKHNLDQREQFRQTIQRYWESTLIRDLLDEKGAELRKTTVVSEDEIKEYYEAHKELLGEAPLEEQRAEILSRLEDQKVSDKLQTWINELRQAATIDIRDQELAARLAKEVQGG